MSRITVLLICSITILITYITGCGKSQTRQTPENQVISQPAEEQNVVFNYSEIYKENENVLAALPNVLIIGDSISMGYGPFVQARMEGKANVYRLRQNGGPTAKGLKYIDQWLSDIEWDVIHFNWGLHDLKRVKQGDKYISGTNQESPEQYAANLQMLVKRLKATRAKLIFAATTPVPAGCEKRDKGQAVVYNEIAKAVMKRNNIPVNDLYSYILPHLDEYMVSPGNVHYNKQGNQFLGKKVAEEISKNL